MSQGNVEIVQRMYEAAAEIFATGDLGRLDESFFDPGVEWHDAADQPDGQVYHGIEGVRRALRGFLEAWSNYSCDVEETIEAADERVVVLTHERGRGKTSGVEIDQRGAHIWTFRDGKVVEFRAYWDRNRALELAGLRDSGPRT